MAAGGCAQEARRSDPQRFAMRNRTMWPQTADNPEAWAFHCLNPYHQEAGMIRKAQVV